jgi:hypothetical protein
MTPLGTSGRKAEKTDLRLIGRSAWTDDFASLTVWHAGCGFEAAFHGSVLRIELAGSPWNVPGKEVHVGIWIDDLKQEEPHRTVVLGKESVEIAFLDLGMQKHVVRLIKRSEAIDSTLTVHAVLTDGAWLEAPGPKPLQIEFVGASNSCGYGTLGPLGQPKTTANSSVFAAFSYQAARLLDADASIVSASGWGVTRGYNTEGQASVQKTLPFVYEHCGITPLGEATFNHPWRHPENTYHAIVLNMGSNDFNASNYNTLTDIQQSAFREDFARVYHAFLRRLRDLHPYAWIVCTYGMSNEDERIKAMFESIASEANKRSGKILALDMNRAGSKRHPFAVDYHPNPQTHLENAKKVATCLRAVLQA